MADWTFSVATPEEMQPYYDPSIQNDPGFDFQGGAPNFDFSWAQNMQFPQSGGFDFGGAPGGFNVGPPAGPTPSAPFNPASVGVPPPLATAGAPAQAAMGPLGGPSGRGDSDADAPPKAGMGAAAPTGPAKYQPGAQSQPSKEGGFDWKKMLGGIGGQVAGAGTQALIGGGMNLLGSALAPRQRQQGQPQPSGPAPAPTTPTGTPNMGAPTPPTPGAQWSPLLMQRPGISGPGGAAGLEAQRRMRRGGQTGGMALY